MEHAKGKLEIVESYEHLVVEHEDAKHSLTKIAIFYKPTEKEKAIAAHLVKCWNNYGFVIKNGQQLAKKLINKRQQCDELLGVLKRIKLRIAFIGHPKEPMNQNGPDWSEQIALLEQAIANAIRKE